MGNSELSDHTHIFIDNAGGRLSTNDQGGWINKATGTVGCACLIYLKYAIQININSGQQRIEENEAA